MDLELIVFGHVPANLYVSVLINDRGDKICYTYIAFKAPARES